MSQVLFDTVFDRLTVGRSNYVTVYADDPGISADTKYNSGRL